MAKASDAVLPERRLLWIEFITLFFGVPVAVALFLPPQAMLPVLIGFTLVGARLLRRTPGFAWSDLRQGWGEVRLLVLIGFAAVTAAVSLSILAAFAPQDLFGMARQRPGLLIAILLAYPVLSALPQEMIFRPLFFLRYGEILPAGARLGLNAAFFSLAHLMYWSGIVAAMTFAGGLVFGWAYWRRGSFPLAVAMHVVAGWVLFAVGLGAFFYSGNVQRPF